jgi:hypothetical protein
MERQDDKYILTEGEFAEFIAIKMQAEVLQKTFFENKFEFEKLSKQIEMYKITTQRDNNSLLMALVMGIMIGTLGFFIITDVFPKIAIIGCAVLFFAEFAFILFLGIKKNSIKKSEKEEETEETEKSE